jgi:hypothetical protein
MQRIGTGKATPTSKAARALRDIEPSFDPAAFARLAAQAGIVGAKSKGSTYLWSEFDILSVREVLLRKNGRHGEARPFKRRQPPSSKARCRKSRPAREARRKRSELSSSTRCWQSLNLKGCPVIHCRLTRGPIEPYPWQAQALGFVISYQPS